MHRDSPRGNRAGRKRSAALLAAASACLLALSACGAAAPVAHRRERSTDSPGEIASDHGDVIGATGAPPRTRSDPGPDARFPALDSPPPIRVFPREDERLLETAVSALFRGERVDSLVSLARVARGPGGEGMWLIPAGGAVCLAWTEHYGHAGSSDALECVSDAEAASGHLIADWQSLPGESPTDHVLGVLPRGSTGLTLELRSGRLQPLATIGGAYDFRATSPRSIRFREGGSERRVLVPRHEGAAPPAAGL